MTQEIIVLVGPSCAGKTTLAKELMSEDINIVRVSRDDIRTMFGNESDFAVDRYVSFKAVKAIIKSGQSVIIDNTNLAQRDHDSIYKLARVANVRIRWIYLLPTIATLLSNRIHKKSTTPRSVILQQHFTTFSLLVDVHKSIGVEFDYTKRKYTILESSHVK